MVPTSSAAATGGRSGPATVLGPATGRPWVTGRVAARVLWDGTAEVSVIDLPAGPGDAPPAAAAAPAGGARPPPPQPNATAEPEAGCCVQ